MDIVFTSKGWKDFMALQKENPGIWKKVNDLIKEIVRDPMMGCGNPEILKHEWTGYMSRRINKEHRLIYRISGNQLRIVQCRCHYKR